jgi:hypothetical protein
MLFTSAPALPFLSLLVTTRQYSPHGSASTESQCSSQLFACAAYIVLLQLAPREWLTCAISSTRPLFAMPTNMHDNARDTHRLSVWRFRLSTSGPSVVLVVSRIWRACSCHTLCWGIPPGGRLPARGWSKRRRPVVGGSQALLEFVTRQIFKGPSVIGDGFDTCHVLSQV